MARSRRRETVKTSKLKTLLCTYVGKPEGCQYGANCAFAHSVEELRTETPSLGAAALKGGESLNGGATTTMADTATADGEPSGHDPFLRINNAPINNAKGNAAAAAAAGRGGGAELPVREFIPVSFPPSGSRPPPRKNGNGNGGATRPKGGGAGDAPTTGPHPVMKVSWNPSGRDAYEHTSHRTVAGTMLHHDGTQQSFMHSLLAPHPVQPSYVLLTDPRLYPMPLPHPEAARRMAPADHWPGPLVYSMLPPPPPMPQPPPPAPNPSSYAFDFYPLAYRDWSAGKLPESPLYPTTTPESSRTPHVDRFPASSSPPPAAVPSLHTAAAAAAGDLKRPVLLQRPCKMTLGSAVEKPRRRPIVMNQHRSCCRMHLKSPIETAEVEELAPKIRFPKRTSSDARERDERSSSSTESEERDVEYVI